MVVENYLKFARGAVAVKSDLPSAIDAIEFESFLVSHGVVLLYARMEQCFRQALSTRCNRCVDLEVRAFALSVKDEKTGRIGIRDVKGTLKRFGIDCRDGFSLDLETSNFKESWDSVMNQRHQVAHDGQPASLTLSELHGYYEGIRSVLGFICKALSLNTAEVTEISSLIILPENGTPAVLET